MDTERRCHLDWLEIVFRLDRALRDVTFPNPIGLVRTSSDDVTRRVSGFAWALRFSIRARRLQWKNDRESSTPTDKHRESSYNPGQNYVGHSCRMLCLDHVFHMETNVLRAKLYLLPLPHAMLFERKGFSPSRPTLNGRGGGGGGGGGRIFGLQEFCIKGIQVSHTFWPGLHVVRLIEAKSLQSHTADIRYSAVRLTRFWVSGYRKKQRVFVAGIHTCYTSILDQKTYYW